MHQNNITMKLQIKTETISEVEVTFPCYRKYGSFTYFKVIDEKTTLSVWFTGDGDVEIQLNNYVRQIAFDSEKSVEITPEEFSRIFIWAKNKINELK